MTFKLKSGNGPLKFKMMGSSPIRGHEVGTDGEIIQHEEQDTRSDAVKELDKTLDQIDRAKLYRATQKDKAESEETGVRTHKNTAKAEQDIYKNRKNRGALDPDDYPHVEMGDTGVITTETTTKEPKYIDKVTGEGVDTKDVSIKTRKSEHKIHNPPDHDMEDLGYTDILGGRPQSSKSSVFDAEKNIVTTTTSSNVGLVTPKVDMPTINLPVKTEKIELPSTEPPDKLKKKRIPSYLTKTKKKKIPKYKIKLNRSSLVPGFVKIIKK